MTESLTLAYWNTSLSPATGKKKTDKQREVHQKKLPIAKQVIETLVQKNDVDLLAVSEVDESDLTEFKTVLAQYGYDYISGVESMGRTRFDLGLFYKAEKVNVSNHIFLTTNIRDNAAKNAL